MFHTTKWLISVGTIALVLLSREAAFAIPFTSQGPFVTPQAGETGYASRRPLRTTGLSAGRYASLCRRLHVEMLEDRRMLAVITVDSLLDNFDLVTPTTDGLITLRR